jgi:NAD(P)-dependent dehydrogenase (short-subunit alcohol dehydrogenase family)
MPGPRNVVITGASTGIGRACALHLDALGWRVFAGVRRTEDAESLRSSAFSHLATLLLDVTDPDSIRRAQVSVEEAVGAAGLSGLVSNAGIGYGGPVELLDLQDMRRAFEVNFFGAIAVTQAFLPLLRTGRGRIVMMSSVSGMVASPFLSPYTTSKWALEALSDAMRVELKPWGIQVSVVQPGAINTPIWEKGHATAQQIIQNGPRALIELYGPLMERLLGGLKPHGISVAHVATAVEHALAARRPKTRYRVGSDAALGALARYLPDRVRDWFFLRRLGKRP